MERVLITIERYKKEVLIATTLVVCSIFCYIVYKSYKISKIKQNPDNLLIIKSKIEQIKIKNELEIKSEDKEYESIITDNEDSKQIKVADNGGNEVFLSLNDKIEELSEGEFIEEKENKEKQKKEGAIREKVGYKVQLVALRSEKQAKNFIENTKDEYGYLLKNLNIFQTSIDLGEKGVFYRVQVGFFNTLDVAQAFCKTYLDSSKRGLLNCIVVR
jgi:hypothetical protein